MKASLVQKLNMMAERLAELEQLVASENATHDLDQYRKWNREHAEIAPIVTQFQRFQLAEKDLNTAFELQKDPEMRDFAQEEIEAARLKIEAIEKELQTLLLPQDPNDERNIYLEIRAGTGGDESALFAGSLLRMYLRFAERSQWKAEVISESPSEVGGFKEVIYRIIGAGAYSKLKFESGAHRVQRVPETEAQGRIHTSACTVAVLPEADELEEININPADLRIDTFRASGAGGQHINKTDSAVRITHLPSGVVVECQDDRSQHKNRSQAMRVLASRLKDEQMRKQQAAQAATRKSLVGSGDRSERIRTYNFPQGRITDHRINLTLYKIEAIMDGDLFELSSTLTAEHQAELLAAINQT